MSNTATCPYCGYENEINNISDHISDNENTFDIECYNCVKEFEVYVEFEPYYYTSKIEEMECEECGKLNRKLYDKTIRFPFPKKIENKKVCNICWGKYMYEEMKDE